MITQKCRKKAINFESECMFGGISFPSAAKLREIVGGRKLFSLIMMMQKTFLVFCININGKYLVIWIWKGEEIIMLHSLSFIIFNRISG